ncbi:MAG: hypothetical protein K5888_00080 [Lachnospiraceae bacterium]|nr:hypothetical protein [Lachnospiraceae bacterium]
MCDPDRKKIVNDVFYRKIYSSEVWEPWVILDHDNLTYYSHGYCIPIVKQYDPEKLSDKYIDRIKRIIEISNRHPNYGMMFSGDADYNLKRFGNDKQTHSLYNFSLLPVRGGINRKKGSRSGYNEQFGLFLQGLKDYFGIKDDKRKKGFIKTNFISWGRTKDEYKETVLDFYIAYFDLFDGFCDYCEKVYLIDRVTVDKIIGKEVNKKNIDTTYDNVVKLYWENRKKRIREIYTEYFNAGKEYDELMTWDLGEEQFV